MLPDEKVMCPATGFGRSCKDIVVNCFCPKFVVLQGTNPNTGEAMNKAGCVDQFLPMLHIETANQMRQLARRLNSFRNEMVALNGAIANDMILLGAKK